MKSFDQRTTSAMEILNNPFKGADIDSSAAFLAGQPTQETNSKLDTILDSSHDPNFWNSMQAKEANFINKRWTWVKEEGTCLSLSSTQGQGLI